MANDPLMGIGGLVMPGTLRDSLDEPDTARQVGPACQNSSFARDEKWSRRYR